MNEITKLIILGIIGFLIAQFFAGKKAGEQGIIKSLKFSTKNYTIHLHHWLIGLLVMLALYEFYNVYVYGLLIGMTAQGLTYSDFYKIIYRKKSLK